MSFLEGLLLGIIQGLTEFLPISSSGHIELGKVILNAAIADDVLFTVILHFATVLSIMVVFYKDLIELISGIFQFKWNSSAKYVTLIVVSMIPVGVVGVFFEDKVDALFTGNLLLVGAMLIVTGFVLLSSYLVKDRNKKVNLPRALLIGVAQMIAILPGISRSGATITTALLLGVDRKEATRFAFLMLLLPVVGATILKMRDFNTATSMSDEYLPLIAGFLAAFLVGLLACRWMIQIVRNGKLYYFSIYCFVVGITAMIWKFI